MSDFANIAAATAAGYKLVQQGVGPGGIGFETILQKVLDGDPNEDAPLMTAYGYDGSAQAAADSNAVAALNAQRSDRYGFGEPGGELTEENTAATADVT